MRFFLMMTACVGLAMGAQAAAIPSAHVPLAVSSHAAPLLAPAPATRRMTLAVALPIRNAAALDALLARITDPSSPDFRHYLSVADYADRFGPTKADYEAATAFFTASGLRVVATSPNRYLIDLEGSAADVERVFHVRMGLYRHPSEQRAFIAPDREPTLDLAVPISHVVGLDDFHRPVPRLARAAPGAAPRATGSGPGGQFLGSDVRAAYYPGGTLIGTGQSVGLMELAGYNESDVVRYFSTVKQPLHVKVVGISTDGSPLGCDASCGDDTEQVLDIEYTISMAPGLQQVQVYVANSPESVLNRMASDNTSKSLSTSWGWDELFSTDDPLFKEMAVQGQTLLTASGDYSSLNASGPWPEEDANIVAVGGTDLTTHGAGGTWAAETGWAYSAGGPSLDKTIPIAVYQRHYVTTANKGSIKLRNVPDIAGDANQDNYICYNGGCGGGWGGTSFASPIWAGFIALANEEAAHRGKPPVGFINPLLYRLGLPATAAISFHDQTAGVSGAYKCTPSFDLVTGLGSPTGQELLNLLSGGW